MLPPHGLPAEADLPGRSCGRQRLRAFTRQAATRGDAKLTVIGDDDPSRVDTVLSVRVLSVGLAGRKGRELEASYAPLAESVLADVLGPAE